MKKVLCFVFGVLISVSAFASKPTDWTTVKRVVQNTRLDLQKDGKYTVKTETKVLAQTSDGGKKLIPLETVFFNGNAYTLKQVYTNWSTLSASNKADFREAVEQAINEDVE